MAWLDSRWAGSSTASGTGKAASRASRSRRSYAREGSFFGAMARWQLGEKAQAHAEFDRADACFKGYEQRT